jgi:hypothetical protein
MDTEKINRAIKAVENEIFMRERVFAKDPKRMQAKLAEMKEVLEVLVWAREEAEAKWLT